MAKKMRNRMVETRNGFTNSHKWRRPFLFSPPPPPQLPPVFLNTTRLPFVRSLVCIVCNCALRSMCTTLSVCHMHFIYHNINSCTNCIQYAYTLFLDADRTTASSHRASVSSPGGNGRAPATSSHRASPSRLAVNGKAPAPELNPELPFNRFKAGEGVLISHQAAQTVSHQIHKY